MAKQDRQTLIMYVAFGQDRHADPEVEIFFQKDKAIDWANGFVQANARVGNDIADVTQDWNETVNSKDKERVLYLEYGPESDGTVDIAWVKAVVPRA